MLGVLGWVNAVPGDAEHHAEDWILSLLSNLGTQATNDGDWDASRTFVGYGLVGQYLTPR